MNDFTNGPAGSAAGTALGTESVREFRVEVNAYGAEFGRNAGGQINVLTKSGTNAFHGSGLRLSQERRARRAELLRPCGEAGFPPPPVRLHPGRAGAQGPDVLLRRATRACARDLGRTVSTVVPNVAARAGILPDPTRPGGHDHGPREPGGSALPRRVPPCRTAPSSARASPPTPSLSPRPWTRTTSRRGSTRTSAPKTSSSCATPSTKPASTCPPTSRSSRGPSSRRTSSRPRSIVTSFPRGPSPPCVSVTAARGSGSRWRRTRRSRWRLSCPAARSPGTSTSAGSPASAPRAPPTSRSGRTSSPSTATSSTRGGGIS